ncbi:hypothetical protein PPL_04632 [Heterostelium album PN500]|uniref:Prokaryotic glutathione synthetase ATP-binding domain-containing protein n=1 Tax=Heterostelium pallidum (strain ATCC 26659 / Pp 5 / PN500) TaxID=670386 RepID=D3B841_HETP5|nr:hypothetical protein PPL_04632 [Heterostelium album PN500]EFA82209.1 hypothetical protein PPL_04632 [Heterostelium album PN500]|eukprot:XP_020434326.1 hypothetical protein PPL_04632 [Heterostelium album PN500]
MTINSKNYFSNSHSGGRVKRIGFVTSTAFPNLDEDDHIMVKNAINQYECEYCIWDDNEVQWQSFDLLIIRSVWDYVHKFELFKRWMKKIELLGIQVLNDFNIIRWNWNKNYLKELEQAGVSIVPSLFVESTSIPKSLLQYAQEGIQLKKFNKNQYKFVLKPCVGASSYGTYQFTLDNWSDYQQEFSNLVKVSDMIIQPFVETIQSDGETSFIFFNKKFSHSIVKHPSKDDFRVQENYGGTYEKNKNLTQDEIDIAQSIMDYVGKKGKILYTRIDMLRYNNRLCLSECELFEPTLYFMNDDKIAKKFVSMIGENIAKPSDRLVSVSSISIDANVLVVGSPSEIVRGRAKSVSSPLIIGQDELMITKIRNVAI